ncbi:MAG: NCS2 family permease, partial [Acidobacteriota bacterium]
IAGLVVTIFLVSRGVRGALLLGIFITTALAMVVGVSPIPHGLSGIISFHNPFQDLAGTAFHLDIRAAFHIGLITILFTLTFVDLFDNIGTLIGVARKANLLDDKGDLPRIGKALFSDSLGTMFGALMGTSTVTSYVESAAGVSEGGKTGLTAVVIGVLFLAALLFAPLVGFIPAQATAPALIVVGVLMTSEITHIKFSDFTEAVPAFLTIIMMPLTFSIAEGLAFGFVSFTLVKLLSGRWRENNAVTYVCSVLFILHFVLGKS